MKKKGLTSVVIALLMLLCSVGIQSQNNTGNPFIRNYTPKEYGFNSQTWATIQDTRGVMYFGGNEGIIEFDGKNWRLIQTSNKSHVRALAVDENGTIFVGAGNDFGYLYIDAEGKKAFASLTNKLEAEDKKFDDIWSVNTTSHGVYFFAANRYFRLHNNKIEIKKIANTLFSNAINDNIFFLQEEGGIGFIKNGELNILPHTEKIGKNVSGLAKVIPYNDKELLIVADLNTKDTLRGFFRYNFELYQNTTDKKKIPKSVIQKLNFEVEEYIRNNYLYDVEKIGVNYVFGTTNGGIIITDEKGKPIQVINNNRGIQNNSMHDLYIDDGNNIWAALNSGISYIETGSKVTFYNKLNNLKEDVVSIFEHKEELYIGAFDGIYNFPEHKINLHDDKYTLSTVEGYKAYCFGLIEIEDKLFAASNGGLLQIKNNKAKQVAEAPRVISLGKSDKFKNFVFVGLYPGFAAIEYKVDKKNNVKFKQRIDFKEVYDPITNIVADKNGDLWLSTVVNGVINLKLNSDDITDYKLIHYDTSRISFEPQNTFPYNLNDELIVCASDGIYKANYDNDTLVTFVKEQTFGKYFNDNSISVGRIYLDKDENIWIGSQEFGFTKVFLNDEKKYEIDNVSFKKIPSKTLSKFYVDSDKNTWIATSEGLFKYNPGIEKNYRIKYNTLIREVSIGEDSVVFNGAYFDEIINPDKKRVGNSLKQPQELIKEFEYQYNNIKFNYSTLFFEHADNNLFSYKLEGFDENWSSWTKKTEKEYTNLPPGEYVFMVKSKNIFDYQSTVAKYKFYIQTPWYRTIVAYVIYLLLTVLLIWFIVKQKIKSLKAANIKLENIVQQRTHEIREKNAEIVTQNEELIQSREEISAQRDAIEEKNKELEKLSIAISYTDNAILILDEKANLEWANSGFEKLFNSTLEEHVKKHGRNMFESSSNPNIKEIYEKCIETRKPVSYESKISDKNGKEKWLQTTLTPIPDLDDSISRMIAIDADITKIKEAENEIRVKNEKINSSIQYAQTIQNAILPSSELVSKYFDNFIVFRPKDIVSGDFYWYANVENSHYIAVVDCTGHGVPGAFMSMIGSRLLNEIIVEQKINSTKEILNELNSRIYKALRQEQTAVPDGMDLCLCKIDLGESPKLMFTGAKVDLIWYRAENKQLEVIKGDRKSIGGPVKRNKREFTNTELELNKEDILYLATDGFVDQNNLDRMKFGSREFYEMIKLVKDKPLKEQKQVMELILDEWMKGAPQRDDITVIALKI